MRKITVTLYEAENGTRFARKEGGGYVTLINPEGIDIISHGLFGATSKENLTTVPGIANKLMDAKIELADFLRHND